MKVRYRIPVSGTLRLEYAFPIEARGFIYEFEADELGVVSHLNATIHVPDREHWPRFDYTPEAEIKYNVVLNSPYFSILRHDLRAASGTMSLYGVDDVEFDEAEEFWEPASDEEREALGILSFKHSREPTSPEKWPRISFDLIARALLSADRASDFEAALNFFRKGRIDVKARQYLDAVLDFLYMVETTYAGGKFRTAQVETEYLASMELLLLVKEAMIERGLHQNVQSDARILNSSREKYVGKSPEQIVCYLVRLRGELHHHTSRKSGIWHPTDHLRFGADAYFLQQLCVGVAFKIATPALWSAEVERSFGAQAHAQARAGNLRRYK